VFINITAVTKVFEEKVIDNSDENFCVNCQIILRRKFLAQFSKKKKKKKQYTDTLSILWILSIA
jgi:hypothetical protein